VLLYNWVIGGIGYGYCLWFLVVTLGHWLLVMVSAIMMAINFGYRLLLMAIQYYLPMAIINGY
jgi:hypothetical protein